MMFDKFIEGKYRINNKENVFLETGVELERDVVYLVEGKFDDWESMYIIDIRYPGKHKYFASQNEIKRLLSKDILQYVFEPSMRYGDKPETATKLYSDNLRRTLSLINEAQSLPVSILNKLKEYTEERGIDLMELTIQGVTTNTLHEFIKMPTTLAVTDAYMITNFLNLQIEIKNK